MKLIICSLSNQIKIARIQYHVYQSSHGDKNILKLLRSLRVNLTLKQKSKHVTLMNSTNVENLWKNEEMIEPKQKDINVIKVRNIGRQLGLKDMQKGVLDRF